MCAFKYAGVFCSCSSIWGGIHVKFVCLWYSPLEHLLAGCRLLERALTPGRLSLHFSRIWKSHIRQLGTTRSVLQRFVLSPANTIRNKRKERKYYYYIERNTNLHHNIKVVYMYYLHRPIYIYIYNQRQFWFLVTSTRFSYATHDIPYRSLSRAKQQTCHVPFEICRVNNYNKVC